MPFKGGNATGQEHRVAGRGFSLDNPFGDLAADGLIHDLVKTVQQYQAFPVQKREVLMLFDQPIMVASRVSMGILSHRNPNPDKPEPKRFGDKKIITKARKYEDTKA